VPVGSAFHARTLELCESLNYRDWAGYYAVSAYETHHEHEYNAIRNACALIDISPLFKYCISGPHAVRLVNRVITRDASRMAVGQVFYTPWCDEAGKVIDDGTVTRLSEDAFRWTAADPNLRWFTENASGLDVHIEDMSESVAALALQGPTSARLLAQVCDADLTGLKYFRATSGHIAGVPVDVSRTGYTGDLGFEIWMPWDRALEVWDAIASAGHAFDLHPTGMLALDVARIEAGLLLIDVDFHSSRKALIESQKYSPYELGMARLVDLEKGPFIGRAALAEEVRRGIRRQIVGLEVDWTEVETLYEAVGLPPTAPAGTSRVAVPVYHGRTQIGRATSTTWSSTLKKLIALATLDAPHYALGTRVQMEMTVDAVRHRAAATVVPTPFFNPARKTSGLL
jgi:aminomethyltransferase